MDTTAFLARVRQTCQLNDVDEDWSDSEVLAEATQALYERFTRPISIIRNGYWLHREVQNMVVGTSAYRMPARAIVQGLEKLEKSVDGGTTWKSLNILTDFETQDYSNATEQSEPKHFSLEGDCVVLYPTPSSSEFKLRMSYYLRPSRLIATVATGVVFSFNSTSITVSGNPTGYLEASGTLDVVHTTGCNEVAIVGLAYTLITSLGANLWRIDLTAGQDLTKLVAGQVVRATDQTDQIPLPMELHSALVTWTSAVLLTAKGDLEKASPLAAKADAAVQRIVDMAVPRIKSRPYTFKTRNTFLRRRVGFGIGWR